MTEINSDNTSGPEDLPVPPDEEAVAAFWNTAAAALRIDSLGFYLGHTILGTMIPPTCTFGLSHHESRQLTWEILNGQRTAIATPVDEDAGLPDDSLVETLSIMCTWEGDPVGVIRTDLLQIATLDQIDNDFAKATGDCLPNSSGDYLAPWLALQDEQISRLLLERFTLLYPKVRGR